MFTYNATNLLSLAFDEFSLDNSTALPEIYTYLLFS
jgi:hypothetical protein